MFFFLSPSLLKRECFYVKCYLESFVETNEHFRNPKKNTGTLTPANEFRVYYTSSISHQDREFSGPRKKERSKIDDKREYVWESLPRLFRKSAIKARTSAVLRLAYILLAYTQRVLK